MRRDFRALVVDDDAFTRATAMRLLARLGAGQVLEATDGRAALGWTGPDDLDLILCDLRMPEVDGIETLGALARRNPKAVFILASSVEPRLLRAAASSAQRAGIASLQVLSKPITVRKLQGVLDSVHSQHADATAGPRPDKPDLTLAEIHRGLAAGEFTNFYQPKVSASDRRLTGAEALLRWRHPRHGLLAAGAFLPLFRCDDLLRAVFASGFPLALKDCASWTAAGYAGGVSINLPTCVLADRELPNRLERSATAAGLNPDRVTLELTEDGWLAGDDLAREVLTRIRLRGFGLSIDDFGTGYSGLQQLLHAPFNELKIDGTFIRAAPVDAEAAIALRSIVALARQLELRIVAEGVETTTEWDHIAAVGCDEVQGFLVSHALPAHLFAAEQLPSPPCPTIAANRAATTPVA